MKQLSTAILSICISTCAFALEPYVIQEGIYVGMNGCFAEVGKEKFETEKGTYTISSTVCFQYDAPISGNHFHCRLRGTSMKVNFLNETFRSNVVKGYKIHELKFTKSRSENNEKPAMHREYMNVHLKSKDSARKEFISKNGQQLRSINVEDIFFFKDGTQGGFVYNCSFLKLIPEAVRIMYISNANLENNVLVAKDKNEKTTKYVIRNKYNNIPNCKDGSYILADLGNETYDIVFTDSCKDFY